jgi:hypothetical protein
VVHPNKIVDIDRKRGWVVLGIEGPPIAGNLKVR